MIVKMKKITIVISEKDNEKFLKEVRTLGIVHVKHVAEPSGDGLLSCDRTIEDTKEAISTLESIKITKKVKNNTGKPTLFPEDYVKKVISLTREKDNEKRCLEDTSSQLELFKPWGSFDPNDLGALNKKGISVKLYRTTKREYKKAKPKGVIKIIKEDKHYIYLAYINNKLDGEKLPFREIEPPKESCEELYKREEDLKHRIWEIDNTLSDIARFTKVLKKYLFSLQDKHTFLSTLYGMGKEERISYIQGFCPSEKTPLIQNLSQSFQAAYLIEDPPEGEEVPTLVRNPKWIRIISPVFKFMNTIPGYKEYDISFPFLVFFSLFFAMLIGDAGYGLLFVSLTFLAQLKLKKAPKEIFFLLYVLSFATIAWGAITGTWFGSEEIAKMPFFNALIISEFNSFSPTSQNFMLYFCFIIAVMHLTIAHLIVAIKKINTLMAISDIGWILTIWGLFFVAGTLIVNKPFPPYAVYFLISGVIFILLFSSPQKNFIKGILITIVNAPIKIISSFSDVVSYLRLFAVGYASVAVASTFNNMAESLGWNTIAAGLGSAVILFFGHTLNIILGFMAVVVHGIRLNMLEFSGQMGMEWSGKEYDPFKEKEVKS